MSTLSAKQVVYIWFVYVLIDMFIFGILAHLHSVYLNVGWDRSIYEIHRVPLFSLLGLFGKLVVIAQYPIMFIALYLQRKGFQSQLWRWVILPVASFIVAYCFYVVLSITVTNRRSVPLATELKGELRRWSDYEHTINAVQPIALISAVLATIFWVWFLKRKIRTSSVSNN